MLERLGIPADDDQVYLALLRHPRLTVAGLAERSGLGRRAVEDALTRLTELGIVGGLAGRPVRYLALSPDIAVEMVLSRHREAAAIARAEADMFLAALPATGALRGDDRLELLVGRQAARARVRRLLGTAKDELLVLNRLPLSDSPDPASDDGPGLAERGVRVRWIRPPDAPAPLDEAGGVQLRIHDGLPTDLVIVDGAVALLPLTGAASADQETVLVVRSSPLLGALVLLFELLWQASVPASGREGARKPDGRLDDRLWLLLAAGLKDEAIAKQLGVSLRTVHRRTHELLEQLGARTRFQAGMRAAQRGMLPGDGL